MASAVGVVGPSFVVMLRSYHPQRGCQGIRAEESDPEYRSDHRQSEDLRGRMWALVHQFPIPCQVAIALPP